MSIEIFVTAIALAFIIEGLFPALFPNRWRSYVTKLAKESPQSIRNIGLSVVGIGVVILWFIY